MAKVIQIDDKVYLNVKLHYTNDVCFDVVSAKDNQYVLLLPPAEYIVIVDKKELHEKFKKKG